MTSGHVRWLCIGNPADPSGEFARAYHSQDWHSIRIDAYDSPNIKAGENVLPYFPSVEWLAEMQQKCGPDYENNAEYQFKVRGLFPTVGVDTLISVGDFQAACRRSGKPAPEDQTCLGVDVARFGDDRTVLVAIRDPVILHSEAYGHQDLVFTAGRVAELAPQLGIHKADARRIAVDDTGVGGGVVDLLRAQGWGVNAENFGKTPARDEETCLNRRTELWVALRDWIRDEAALAGLDAATRQELESDLTTVKYKFKPDGRRMLEPKADQKTRIGRSPDYGDALALALASKTARRRLDYSGLLRSRESRRGDHCTDQRPCGDRDCSHCGWRVKGPDAQVVG